MGKENKQPDQLHRLQSRGLWRAVLAATVALLCLPPFPFAPLRLSFSAHAATGDSEVVSTSTREGRLAVFDDAWSTINKRYYDPEFHALGEGLDWDAQRKAFRSLAAEANSAYELYAVLRLMIASLNDPHTRVFAPEEKFDWWRPRFVSIGLAIREVAGLPTVIQVERGSGAERAGVRAGDVIESVDGKPALSLVTQRLIEATSVRLSSRYRAFATVMEGPPETSVELRWRGKDGKEKSSRFRRYWQQRDLKFRVRKVKGEYAVLEIDAFTKPIASDFARALKEKTAAARGLILDLRSNGGGDAEAMTEIASSLLGAGFDLGQFTDRSANSFPISTRSKSLFLPEGIGQTSLPLIVLTSERTSSAAEILTAALKTFKRATIIGSETCGCVLAIRTRHLLPDGGLLDVSELDYQTAAGERLERNGIQPNETVVVQRNDLYSGRDRALELAIARLTNLRIAQSEKVTRK